MLSSSSISTVDKNGEGDSLPEDSNTRNRTTIQDGHFFVDNFSLTEQEVKKSFVDDVPSIDFSERVYQLLEKEMSTSVVLKMLGRNLGITTLHNRLYGIWRPSKPFQLMDIENGYFIAKFQSTDDYDKILSQGPWVIFGHYLTVQPWTIDFNPSLPYPNMILTWI
ncbi:hypothetical protein PVK06_044897 [Gossypium arboreum]|uniref:DUF4283 domain-containing protein n=1 Tax=Gossypium arboreum TaxID=29729 RepID=A0ABR0MSZ4_GOSAR|nr:hypothetical protein PVK06_044897 [Gossypium arboreum]